MLETKIFPLQFVDLSSIAKFNPERYGMVLENNCENLRTQIVELKKEGWILKGVANPNNDGWSYLIMEKEF